MSEGPRGERGPTGDHGQSGEPGVAGVSGPAGGRGQPGATGRQGARGDAAGPPLSRGQQAAIWALFVGSFALLAWRTEVQQRSIERNTHRLEQIQYQQCTDQHAYAVRIGATIDDAVQAERRLPKPDAKRIRDLESFKVPIRECGPPPQR